MTFSTMVAKRSGSPSIGEAVTITVSLAVVLVGGAVGWTG